MAENEPVWVQVHGCLPQALADVAAGGHRRHCRRGEVIFTQGDVADRVYLVESGIVKMAFVNRFGEERIARFVGPGGLFGESGVLGGKGRYGITASSLGPSVVLSFSRDQVRRLMESRPEFSLFLLSSLVEKLWIMGRQLVSASATASSSSLQKVASSLLYLSREWGRQDPRGVVLPFTHEQVAGFAGVNRVTVTKVLKTLAALGIVETGFRRILIRDVDRLRRHTL